MIAGENVLSALRRLGKVIIFSHFHPLVSLSDSFSATFPAVLFFVALFRRTAFLGMHFSCNLKQFYYKSVISALVQQWQYFEELFFVD